VFLNSLPVRRREIVFAKYLAIFLYAALGLGGTALFAAALKAALPSVPVGRPGLPDVAGAFAGAVLLGSAYYPLCFKFGAQKVRLFQLFLFLLIFFLPSFAVEYLQARSSREEAAGLVGAVLHAPAWVPGSAGAALLLAVLLGSLALSLRIYERKEF
jgi:ABC-type Na+ efflux pump permease subunit